jgi:hypothetical protein
MRFMARKSKGPKPLWEKTYPCPFCGELIHTRIAKRLTNIPVKADYDLDEVIEKASQRTLASVEAA